MTLPKIFEIKNYPAKSAFTICLIFILGIIIGELIIETGFTRYYYSNKWMYYFIVFSWFATIYLALIFSVINTIFLLFFKRDFKNLVWIFIGFLPPIYSLISVFITL